jgi:hypothetical protein
MPTMPASLRHLSLVAVAGLAAGCLASPAAFTELQAARRTASALDAALAHETDAANRAVMAADQAATSGAVAEAREAFTTTDGLTAALRATLTGVGYQDDVTILDRFATCLADFRGLTEEVLSLAVDGSNLKAQRLSFGPAAESSDALRASLDDAVSQWPESNAGLAREQALRVYAAVLEMRALHGRHIAEASDDEMTELESRMARSAGDARAALAALRRTSPAAVAGRLEAPAAHLDRFLAINGEIVALSRRNTNVRALALTLGKRRTVGADCVARLQELHAALSRHEFTATR